MNVVEGRHARLEWKVSCVQFLINAAHELQKSKPAGCAYKVVAAALWPSMFSSEVCIYSSREYFEDHLGLDCEEEHQGIDIPEELSTILESLQSPEGFELRLVRELVEDDEDTAISHTEYHIYFGEVSWR